MAAPTRSGALIISTGDGPSSIVDLNTGALVQTVAIPSTAAAAILPSGYFAIINSDVIGASVVQIYKPDYTLHATASGIPSASWAPSSPISAANGNFYILKKTGTPAPLYKFSPDGTVLDSWTIPSLPPSGTSVSSMCISADEKVCYYTSALADGVVRRFDLVARVAMSNLVTRSGGYYVMPDIFAIPGSADIIVAFKRASDATTDAIRYVGAGPYFTSTAGLSPGATAHCALDPNQSNTWWVRIHPDPDWRVTSTFVQFDLTTGAILRKVVVNQFSASPLVPGGVCAWLLVPAPSDSSSGGGGDGGGGGGGGGGWDGSGLNGGTGPLGGPLRNIRRLRQGPHINDAGRQLFGSVFRVDLQNAMGAQVNPLDTPAVPAPRAWHSQTENGGLTWTPYESAPAGGTVEEDIDVEWRRLGVAADRCDRIVVEDPIPWRITNAYIDILPGSY